MRVDDLQAPAHLNAEAVRDRLELWNALQSDFLAKKGKPRAPVAQDTVYRRALEMMNSGAARAFDLSEESDEVRTAYGRGTFGQGCLMARRLVEQGVAFVEVSLGSFGGAQAGTRTPATSPPSNNSRKSWTKAGRPC